MKAIRPHEIAKHDEWMPVAGGSRWFIESAELATLRETRATLDALLDELQS